VAQTAARLEKAKDQQVSEKEQGRLELNPSPMDQAFILVSEDQLQNPRAYLESVSEPEPTPTPGITLKTLWKLAKAVFRHTELPTSLPL
jgi:hypothetical protein